MGAEGDRVALRMQRGCRCFGAAIGGELVGYGWVSTGAEWMGEPQLQIRPGRGDAYVWNCATVSAHRRKGVFGALLRAIKAELKGDGFKRVWIGSLEHPAENAIEGAEFVPVLRLDTSSRWGFRWLRLLPAYKADPHVAAAAFMAVGSRGVPLGAGFYLSRAKTKRH